MQDAIKRKVISAVREVMEQDGLIGTIALSYNDLEYDLPEVFIPRMKDENDDTEYDRLHAQAERRVKVCFSKIQVALKRAQSIIDSVLAD